MTKSADQTILARISARSLIFVFGLLGLHVPALADQLQPIPYELPFDQLRLVNDGSAVAGSANGRWLAYTVHANPLQALGWEMFQPNGLPSPVIGNRIYLHDNVTSRVMPVGPDDAHCWNPSFSPNSRYLVFYCGGKTSPELWITDLADHSQRRLGTTVVRAHVGIADAPEWLADGSGIIVPAIAAPDGTVGDGHGDGARSAEVPWTAGIEADRSSTSTSRRYNPFQVRAENGDLIRVDVVTGAQTILVPANAAPLPSVARISPEGHWLAYLSVSYRNEQGLSRRDLSIVPVTGGSARLLAAGILPTSFAWHPSRDMVLWIKDRRLHFALIGSGRESVINLAADVAGSQIFFSRDGVSVAVGTNPIDAGNLTASVPQSATVISLTDNSARTIPIPSDCVFSSFVHASEAVLWQPSLGSISFLCRSRDGLESTVIQADIETGRHRVLWTGQGTLRLFGGRADHEELFASFETLTVSEKLYRISKDFSKWQAVANIDSRLDGIAIGSAETFETSVPKFDGSYARVTSAVLLPAGHRRGDRLPAIVFQYPGFSDVANILRFGGGSPATIPASIFTTRGFAVLLVDLPIGPHGMPGNPLSEIMDTLLPQVQHAALLGYIDIERVAVAGQSYGGYSTAAILSATNTFSAGIAISGVYDLAARFGRGGELGQFRSPGDPRSNIEWYRDNSPLLRADRIRAPLLMLNGGADTLTPVDDARLMHRSLRRLNRPVELFEYKGEGHAVSGWRTRSAADASRRAIEFLNRYVRRGQ